MDETITKSLLLGLEAEGLAEVLSAFESRSFQAGEAIITMGEKGDELFLLVAGKVRVWTGDGPAMAERTLSVMGAGEHFGEASMISGGPRNATVTALTYVETLVLNRSDYNELIPKHPQLLENISRSLTSRLAQMNAVANRDVKPKRGIYSLGIVIDTPAGWSLAQAVIGQLRQRGRIIRPMIVSDSDLPMELGELDSDAGLVAKNDLAIEVSRRSRGQSLAVAIAYGDQAAQVVSKECDRVVYAMDATSGLSDKTGELALAVPEHRRAIAAMMFDGTVDERPKMVDPRIQCVRVKYSPSPSKLPHLATVSEVFVNRVVRCLSGVRIGLALGGGGARGIAHVGVTRVFAEHGIHFDSVAATSAGAIIGGAIASGFTSDEVGQFFRDDMIPPKIFSSIPALRRAWLLHSFRGGRFEKKLRRYMHHLSFDQLDFPLAVTTLDLVSGMQMIRRDGDLVHGILQSINHPVFGSPIISGNEMLVDGGVLMNVPASVLRQEGCDYVISIDVGSKLSTDFGKDKNGNPSKAPYLATLLRTMELSRRHSSALHAADSDITISPDTQAFAVEDFHSVDALIEVGIKAGEETYKQVQELIRNVEPVSM